MKSRKIADTDTRGIPVNGHIGIVRALLLTAFVVMTLFAAVLFNPKGRQPATGMPATAMPDTAYTFIDDQGVESAYPGGFPAWDSYLKTNLHYPGIAANSDIEGTVVVRFIVEEEGNVSDVRAISGPESGGLREEAIRVIRNSGKWTPALEGNRPVRSYKSQPIVFRLETN